METDTDIWKRQFPHGDPGDLKIKGRSKFKKIPNEDLSKSRIITNDIEIIKKDITTLKKDIKNIKIIINKILHKQRNISHPLTKENSINEFDT
jgi:hypothetical protein